MFLEKITRIDCVIHVHNPPTFQRQVFAYRQGFDTRRLPPLRTFSTWQIEIIEFVSIFQLILQKKCFKG